MNTTTYHNCDLIPEVKVQSLGEWRPIETAPINGVEILVVLPNGDIHVVYGHRYGFDFEWAQFDGVNSYNPTHWMPLPQPPKE